MAAPFTSILSTITPPQWGIFAEDGSPALVADSVFGFEYSHEYRISDYKQEQGAFFSYNKVQEPFVCKVQYLIGDPVLRGQFFIAAEALCASLALVSVITPDIPYLSANAIRVAYRRLARNGVTLVLVEISCEEVRQLQTGTLSNTQSINGAATAQNGNVQAQPSTTPIPTTATALTTQQTTAIPTAVGTQTSPNLATVAPPDIAGNAIALYGGL